MKRNSSTGQFASRALGTYNGCPGFSMNSVPAVVCPAVERGGGCSSSAPAPTAGSPSPRWHGHPSGPVLTGARARPRSRCWAVAQPGPGSGTRGWVSRRARRRTQGYPFLWYRSFMLDQINSEMISSVSRQCPSFYKASVFCPKSQVFLKALMCLEMEATASW